MKIHLVAIDLDGTLLNSAKRITESTAAILRRARKQTGVHIVLASARPPRTVRPFHTLLDLDAPMINYNGALVYDPASQRALMHLPIPAATARGLVDLARRLYPDVVVSAEVLDRWYTDRIEPACFGRAQLTGRPDVVGDVDDWLTMPVTKLLLLGEHERLAQVAAAMARQFRYQVTLLQTEGQLLQIMHATASKAQALRVVAAELGVAREQVMAIGDNANDVGMLQWAGVAVAMGNAVPRVVAVADYVTDHHDADGAANAVGRLILDGLPPAGPLPV